MQIVVSINRYNHIIMFKNTVSGDLARALGITALVLMSLSCSGPESGRIVIPFDRDWKFHLGDIQKGESADLDVSGWRTLDVPHDWAIEGDYDENSPVLRGGGYLGGGTGWYRKCFTLPPAVLGRKIFIEFDGVMANSDVWINGTHLGHRPNGYLPLRYDMTPYLDPDGTNVIAVRADNTVQPASRWYTGAGIYRHVRIMATDPVYLERWGVFITTPEVSDEKAVVSIRSSIINSGDKPCRIQVRNRIVSPSGKTVKVKKSRLEIAAGDTVECEQLVTVRNPRRWDIDTPRLYTAETSVIQDGTVLDNEDNKFGIREFHYESETGFWLNGRNLKILGACVHHDGGPLGAAVPASVWERRISRLKEIGCNALRGAHSPMDDTFYNICDSLGVLVFDETFDTWKAAKPNGEKAYNLYFDDWWATDTEAQIVRVRNHPSIVLYSLGNEIRDNLNSPEGRKNFLNLRDLTKKLDPTRPVTMALFRPVQMNLFENGFADMLDIIGQNYGEQILIAAGKAKPGRKIIGTENNTSRTSWLAVRDTPAMAGMFVWAGIDYLGESDWPRVSWNKGLFDRNCNWRNMSWERQSWWTDEPMVHIVRRDETSGTGWSDDWTPASADGDTAEVAVYSNCDEVELFLNGRSLGVQTVAEDDSPNIWTVPYEAGEIRAEGRRDGKTVAEHSHRSAGAAERIELSTERESLPFDWEEVAYLTATISDSDGVRNPNSSDMITFSVEGPGEIIAVDNSDAFSHERYKSDRHSAFKGQATAIIRATAASGTIIVSASSGTLGSDSVEIEISNR